MQKGQINLTDFHRNSCYNVQPPAAASTHSRYSSPKKKNSSLTIIDVNNASFNIKQHKESVDVDVKMWIPKNMPAKRYVHS